MKTTGDTAIDSALAYYFERHDQGEKIDCAALCQLFPQCATELTQFFDNEQRINKRLQN